MMSTTLRDQRSSDTEQTEQDPTSIPKDDAFHLLQNTRRRAVLRYMLEAGGDEFVMRDIAEAVAAWDHGTTVDRLRSAERQRAYISLYQSHLPKLAHHDVIDYDQDRGIVAPCPRLRLLEPYLGDGLDATDVLTPRSHPDLESRGLFGLGLLSL